MTMQLLGDKVCGGGTTMAVIHGDEEAWEVIIADSDGGVFHGGAKSGVGVGGISNCCGEVGD